MGPRGVSLAPMHGYAHEEEKEKGKGKKKEERGREGGWERFKQISTKQSCNRLSLRAEVRVAGSYLPQNRLKFEC